MTVPTRWTFERFDKAAKSFEKAGAAFLSADDNMDSILTDFASQVGKEAAKLTLHAGQIGLVPHVLRVLLCWDITAVKTSLAEGVDCRLDLLHERGNLLPLASFIILAIGFRHRALPPPGTEERIQVTDAFAKRTAELVQSELQRLLAQGELPVNDFVLYSGVAWKLTLQPVTNGPRAELRFDDITALARFFAASALRT